MSYSDNKNGSDNYPITETNMYVNLLANSEKLVSEHKRWNYSGGVNPELDDDHENYMNDKKSDRHSEDRRSRRDDEDDDRRSRHDDDDRRSRRSDDDDRRSRRSDGDDEERHMTHEEKMLQKLDMLRKLSELAQAGVKLSQNYNMNSDYKMMKYEYELHKGIRSKQNGINWMSSMMLNVIYGVEMMNDKYNPFSFKLKGWSEQMSADSNNYYDVFGELYEKYNKPGKGMAPELKLLLMISGSALKYHLTNTMMGNLPMMNTKLDEDPVLAEKLRQKAIAQKIKEQTEKNNEKLMNQMSKEHEIATQKASDIAMIQQKEIEFQNLKRENALKNAELNLLKEKFAFAEKQKQTSPVTQPINHTKQQTMQVSPLVQRMMNAKKQESAVNERLTQQMGLQNKSVIPDKLNNLESQANYLRDLEMIKKMKERNEEDNQSSATSKSSVQFNKNINKILSDSKRNMEDEESSEKVRSIGLVSRDDISMAEISIGRKKTTSSIDSKKKTKKTTKKKGGLVVDF